MLRARRGRRERLKSLTARRTLPFDFHTRQAANSGGPGDRIDPVAARKCRFALLGELEHKGALDAIHPDLAPAEWSGGMRPARGRTPKKSLLRIAARRQRAVGSGPGRRANKRIATP
jgi:hypothetical protein